MSTITKGTQVPVQQTTTTIEHDGVDPCYPTSKGGTQKCAPSADGVRQTHPMGVSQTDTPEGVDPIDTPEDKGGTQIDTPEDHPAASDMIEDNCPDWCQQHSEIDHGKFHHLRTVEAATWTVEFGIYDDDGGIRLYVFTDSDHRDLNPVDALDFANTIRRAATLLIASAK